MRTAASVISRAWVTCKALCWCNNQAGCGSTENTAVSKHQDCSGSVNPAGPCAQGVACLYSGKMWNLSLLLRAARQNLHLALGGNKSLSPSVGMCLTQYENDICKVNPLAFTLNTAWFRLSRRLCKYILGCRGFQGDNFVLRNVYGNSFSLGWALWRFWISASSSKTTLLPWTSS